MPDYATLESIDAAFAAGTADAARVASINAATVPIALKVPTSQWESYLATYGFTISLQAYAEGTPPAGATPTSVAAAKMIILIMGSNAVPVVDFTMPAVVAEITALLTALVAEGAAGRLVSIAGAPFAASNQSDLLAMGASTTSRAAQLGFANGVTENDLLAARDPQRGAGSVV
nr:hypothetical protein [uncultured Rhodopila sp.]